MEVLKRHYKKAFAVFAAIMLFVIAGCSGGLTNSGGAVQKPEGSLAVTYVDVGQGDCELIQTPGGKVMLIDAGEASEADKVDAALQERGIDHIDVLVGTHPHTDHIGGLRHIIENYSVGEMYMPNSASSTKTFEKLLDAIDSANIPLHEAKSGVSISLGSDVTCDVLGPIEQYSDLNDTSAVIMLSFGDTRFLFTGDAEKTAESDLLSKYGRNLSCDVLKVGHHGSSTSTSAEFLQAVNPSSAVISCAEGNDYGHPHAETLKKLKDSGISVYRTDISGSITAVSDGSSVTISDGNTENKTEVKPKASEAVAAADSSSEIALDTVYITKSGKAYHKSESCSGLSRSKSITQVTLAEAKELGRKPCSICYG